MSYSFDSDGWDLFNTPFSAAPVRTAPAPSRQQAERSQQKPPEAMQRSHSLTQEQKTPSLSRQTTGVQQKPTAVQPPKPASSATAPAVQNEKPAPATPFPAPKASAPIQADTTKQEPASQPKAPVPASTQSVEPQKELVLDMSSGSGAAPVPDDTEKRKAHEEAEAKRKAEWEAKQAAKKQAEEAVLQKLRDMNDEDVIAASTARISTEVERLTRRNMKECVAAHIQELCRKDTAFARKTMHPRKSMIRCFKYINRMARDYVKQEMEDNDIKPDGGMYGTDVPDWLCFQWSVDYFNATDVLEDQEKEETFTPKPYAGTSTKPTKKAKKTEKKPKKQESKSSNGYEQISLEGVM